MGAALVQLHLDRPGPPIREAVLQGVVHAFQQHEGHGGGLIRVERLCPALDHNRHMVRARRAQHIRQQALGEIAK